MLPFFLFTFGITDPADLFPENVCIAYNRKSEKWPAHSFMKFYQLPVVGASLQKDLKADTLSSNI